LPRFAERRMIGGAWCRMRCAYPTYKGGGDAGRGRRVDKPKAHPPVYSEAARPGGVAPDALRLSDLRALPWLLQEWRPLFVLVRHAPRGAGMGRDRRPGPTMLKIQMV